MMLWLSAGMLTLIALVALWVMVRHRGGSQGVRDARLAVYRDRQRELDGERAAGTLDDARYAEARRELEDAAAVDLRGGSGASTARGPGAALIIVAVVVPALAFGLYAHLGAHDELYAAAAVVEQSPPDVSAMVARLAERMERTPDDLQGWMLLGRSRVQMGEFDAAVVAWRQAHRLAPDDATVAANLGEALVLADPVALEGEGGELFERALDADPSNPKALWYGGIGAAQRGDHLLASERWNHLLTLNPPPELVPVIRSRLEALEPQQ